MAGGSIYSSHKFLEWKRVNRGDTDSKKR